MVVSFKTHQFLYVVLSQPTQPIDNKAKLQGKIVAEYVYCTEE